MITRALVCSSALALAACGTDSAGALADEDGHQGSSGGASTATATATTDPNGTTAGDESADEGIDEGGTSDGASSGAATAPGNEDGPLGPEDFAECEGIDCGDGVCVNGEDGPACECFDGFAAAGLTCIPCTAVASPYPLDIGLVDVVLDVKLAGVDPPASEYEDGNIVLRGAGAGDEILVGSTHDEVLVATVVPGTYDVYYEHESGTMVPANQRAKVATVDMDVGGEPIVIDIPVVPIAGSFAIDGAPPSPSSYESGVLRLVDPTSGDEVMLGGTDAGSFAMNVIAGDYDVRWQHFDGDEVAQNHDAWVRYAHFEPTAEVVQQLAVEIRTGLVSGAITIGGQTPSKSAYESGRIVATDAYTGETIVLGTTDAGSYETRLVHGSYLIHYERIAGGELVPANKRAWVGQLDVGGDTGLDVDVPVVTVSGSFRFDGVDAPPDNGDDAVITLRDASGEDVVVLGNTHDGVFEKLIVPGMYDVYYHHESVGTAVPLNTHALIGPAPVLEDMTVLEVEVPTVDVSGAITLNGAIPPDSEYEDGRIYLRNLDTGDSVLLGSTRDGAFTGKVIPAVYDVVYVVEAAGGAEVPVNSAAVLTTIDVAATPVFDVDVPSIPFSGSLTVAGETPPGNPADNAWVLLEDVKTKDVVYLGNTNAGGYAQPIATGTYVVYYRAQGSSGLVPESANFGVECIELTAP
jgi:hypothetical protein